MKKRFSEEQIIRIIKEYEGGKRAADLVREHNISEQTFYRWKSKYSGMDVSEAKNSSSSKKKTGVSRSLSLT